MSSALFDPMLAGLQRVLDLRQQQHALTASNLANADTPGFKAKVLDFETALSDALGRNTSPMKATRPGHVRSAGGHRPARVAELEPTPWSQNGNSVLPERETARLQENSLMYRAVSTGISKQLALLEFAANDGR